MIPRRYLRRRGSTIAEILFTLGLTVGVMTLGTLLYSHVAAQTGDAVATLDASAGADRIARELQFLISNATAASVTTVSSQPALKLTMPAVAETSNADGLVESYSPSYLHPRGGTVTLPGQRVWITTYPFNAIPNAGGTIPHLARRLDDATPNLSGTDTDWTWSYRDGATKKVRRAPGRFTLAFSITDNVVSWRITTRVAEGAHGTVLDETSAATYREMILEGSTLLRQAKPQ